MACIPSLTLAVLSIVLLILQIYSKSENGVLADIPGVRTLQERLRIADVKETLHEMKKDTEALREAQQQASEQTEKRFEEQAERLENLANQIARDKLVDEAPLSVLAKLVERNVREEDISKRLDAAADELVRLRAGNEALKGAPPEIAVISAEALALVNQGKNRSGPEPVKLARGAIRRARLPLECQPRGRVVWRRPGAARAKLPG
jgi:hypothetical protein